MTLEKKTD